MANSGDTDSHVARDRTARALRLLDLLQSRPVWSGTELAQRLGVTTRSVRRDVDRLRELGYPVNATHGAGGGYQLGAGRRLPPLLLDDDEAIAVAVCLRLAAGGTVAGVGESAVRTLAKLDQVLPAALRERVEVIHEATVTLDGSPAAIDAGVLTELAGAIRAHLQVRFGYERGDGIPSERRVDPYRLVATGRRWYLFAWDHDRDDWRIFRLDRLADLHVTTFRFTPRDAPDAAEHVQRSISTSAYRHVARVLIDAPKSVVSERIPSSVGSIEPRGRSKCVLEAGGMDLTWMAMHLAAMPWDFTVLEPEALRETVRDLAARLHRAGS